MFSVIFMQLDLNKRFEINDIEMPNLSFHFGSTIF